MYTLVYKKQKTKIELCGFVCGGRGKPTPDVYLLKKLSISITTKS